MRSPFVSAFVVATMVTLLVAMPILGQSEHPALKLCREQKFSEAIVLLSNAVRSRDYKADARFWNCLGLANYKTADDKGARKAFETAVKLDPTNPAYRVNFAQLLLMNRKIDAAQSHLERVLKIDPEYPEALYLLTISDSWEGKLDRALATAERLIDLHPTLSKGYVLKADLLVRKLGSEPDSSSVISDGAEVLRHSVDVLKLAQEKVTDLDGVKEIELELANKQTFADYLSREPLKGSSAPVTPEPGVVPLKITYKEKAQYTDRARTANVQGTITIAVVFSGDGRIANTLLIKRLGYGLDENALRAVRKMRFEPQQKDGKPVSVVRLVSFTFNIY